jgi:CRISPR system Cascade subunit CasE
MFLSRVELPWEAVRNPYDIHRHLWRLFPGEAHEARASGDEARQGFLYRIETQGTGRPAGLLLQSRRAPTRVEGVTLLGSKTFDPAPSEGQRLAFVLTANPTKTVVDALSENKPDKLARHQEKLARRPDKKSRPPTCRVPLLKEEDQRAWLARRLGMAAELESVEILPHPPLYFRKGNRAGKLVTCTFEGVLRVSSADGLRALLENGIGPAKGFGCGLMLVRRI